MRSAGDRRQPTRATSHVKRFVLASVFNLRELIEIHGRCYWWSRKFGDDRCSILDNQRRNCSGRFRDGVRSSLQEMCSHVSSILAAKERAMMVYGWMVNELAKVMSSLLSLVAHCAA